jgi:hypothetical protein
MPDDQPRLLKTFIATIQVAVQADNETAVADIMSEAMRERTQDTTFLDWSYVKIGGQWLYATDTNMMNIDPDTYEEGRIFL